MSEESRECPLCSSDNIEWLNRVKAETRPTCKDCGGLGPWEPTAKPAPGPATAKVLGKTKAMIRSGEVHRVGGVDCIPVVLPLAVAMDFLIEHGESL